MQAQIDSVSTTRPVRIFGVNAAGLESGNAAICEGRVIPWLQDTPQANVWGAWSVTYRDVVILGPQNEILHVYNLTTHDLSNPADYATLDSLLLAAAR